MNTPLLRQNYFLCVLLVIGLLLHSTAYGQLSRQTTASQNQHSSTQNTQTIQRELKAQQWGLQLEEWQRYHELMDGPLGIYSPGLDPLTALGISARSDEERRHYAELQVVAETQRVERELAYQRAYDEAFKRMYPNLLPVDFSTTTHSAVAITSGNGRLAIFIRDSCVPCDAKVLQLQQAGTAFDLYMVDSQGDDTLIRRWATRVGIDPQKVFARQITLNHDAGRWQTMGIRGELPAVVREVDGQWIRQ